jgi:hypothetical protein
MLGFKPLFHEEATRLLMRVLLIKDTERIRSGANAGTECTGSFCQ